VSIIDRLSEGGGEPEVRFSTRSGDVNYFGLDEDKKAVGLNDLSKPVFTKVGGHDNNFRLLTRG
jgi:hypothetical protein